jgi:hypothetical protein
MAEKSFVDAKLSKEQIDNAILIADKANEYGVNADLALAMAWQENRFRTKGKSSAGAIGLLQIMPANAKPYGYKVEDLNDPNINVDVGIKILKENLDRFNNPRAALVAYNAGPTTAEKYLEQGESFDALHTETKDYLESIHKIYPLADVPADAKEPAAEKKTSKYFDPIEALPEHLANEQPPVPQDESTMGLVGRKLKESAIEYPSASGFASGALLGEMDRRMNPIKPAAPPPPPAGGVPPAGGGRANEQKFNWQTKSLWDSAKQGEQNLLDLQRRGIVSQGNPSTGFGPIDVTEAGLHIPQGSNPPPPPPPPKSPLERFISNVPNILPKAIREFPRVTGALSGAYTFHEADQARRLAEQNDPIGAAISAAQAGLGGVTMAPIDPRVRAGAMALQLPLVIGKEAWERFKEPSAVKREIKKNPEMYKAKGGKVEFAIPLSLKHVYYHRKKRNG